jgi:uncharacterized protein (TIGR03382 family)
MRTTEFIVALLLGLVVAPRTAAQELALDVMGPEIGIAPPGTGPLRGDQWLVGAAAIDGDLLVAYRDEQAGVVALPLDPLGRLRGARIPIAARDSASLAGVAGGGDGYLVAWFDGQACQAAGIDGSLDRIEHGAPLSGLECRAVARAGGTYLVAGTLLGSPFVAPHTVLYAVPVGPGGEFGEPVPITMSDASIASYALGAGPGGALLAWEEGASIHAARISPNGAWVRETLVVPAAGPAAKVAAVAALGAGYVIVWERRAGASSGHDLDAVATRVDAAGLPLDDEPLLLGPSYGPIAATPHGRSVLVALVADPNGIAVVERVEPTGDRAMTAAVEVGPTLAFAGDVLFFERVAVPPAHADVYAFALGPGGVPTAEPLLVTSGPALSGDASAAWSGDRFVVAWRDTGSIARSGWDVRASFVEVDGRRTLPLALSTIAGDDGPPAVASDGRDAMVFFTDAGGMLRASRIDARGSLLDAVPRPILQTDAEHVAAVWNGVYLVAWPGGAVHVSRDGRRLGVPIALDPDRAAGGAPPAVAPSSMGFLVAFHAIDELSRYRVEVVRIDSSGQPGPLRRIAYGRAPALATDGLGHLLVFLSGHLERHGPNVTWVDDGLAAVRVTADGEITAGPFALTTEPASEPALTRDGAGLVVSWRKSNGSLALARLTGSTLEPFAVVPPPAAGAVLAAGPSDTVLVAYARSDRVVGRLVNPIGETSGGACSSATGSTSGFIPVLAVLALMLVRRRRKGG